MLLELIIAFSDNPDEREAATHLRMRAVRAWYGASVSFGESDGIRLDQPLK